MSDTLTVYHGLGKNFKFSRYTAYFNQPVSTTKEKSVALKFAGDAGMYLLSKI